METEKIIDMIEKIARENYLWGTNSEIYEQDDEAYVVLEAENHTTIRVWFDLIACENCENDMEILEYLLDEMKGKLFRFNADNEFNELWSTEFGKRNKLSPTEFMKMLKDDEQEFKGIGVELERQYFKIRDALDLAYIYIQQQRQKEILGG